jgi:hypothetical protein
MVQVLLMYYLHYRPDDGGSTHLQNVGELYETTRRGSPESYHLHVKFDMETGNIINKPTNSVRNNVESQ